MPGSFIPTLGTLLSWQDVTRFGAKPDNATDCTAAVQGAANAAIASGGGIVYFPPGRYYLAGAVTLPFRDGSSSAPSIPLVFKGAWRPNLLTWGDGRLGAQPATGMSTLRTDASYANGAGWMLNVASGSSPIFGGFSAYAIFAEDLAIETYSNPGVGFLDARSAVQCSLDNLIVLNAARSDLTLPLQTGDVAIRMPAYGNGAQNRIGTIMVNGHYAGLSLGDQITHDGLGMFTACHDALLFDAGAANQHVLKFDRLLVQYCTNGLTATTAAVVLVNVYDAERHNTLGGFEVNDPSNLLKGLITRYNMATGGSGLSGTFAKNGGTNFTCTSF